MQANTKEAASAEMPGIKRGFYFVQVGIGNEITEVFDFSNLVFLVFNLIG